MHRLLSADFRRPGQPDEVTDETHRMRYFFVDELKRFLIAADLSLRGLTPFPDTTAHLSEGSWNVLGTASG